MSEQSQSKSSEPPPEPATADSSEPEAEAKDDAAEKREGVSPEPQPSSIELEPLPSKPGPVPKSPPPKSDRSPAVGRDLPKPAYQSGTPPPAKERRFPPQTVADIMTRKLIALGEEDTVANVEAGMERFRFRHLPVVSPDNKLVGLISHRDLLRYFAEGRKNEDGELESVTSESKVGTIMRRTVLTTRADTTLVTAGAAMLQKKIGCLPVIEEDNTLVGIVTETDFLKLAVELLDRQQPAKRRDRKVE